MKHLMWNDFSELETRVREAKARGFSFKQTDEGVSVCANKLSPVILDGESLTVQPTLVLALAWVDGYLNRVTFETFKGMEEPKVELVPSKAWVKYDGSPATTPPHTTVLVYRPAEGYSEYVKVDSDLFLRDTIWDEPRLQIGDRWIVVPDPKIPDRELAELKKQELERDMEKIHNESCQKE